MEKSNFVNWEETEHYTGTLSGFGKLPSEKGENYFLEFSDGKLIGISATIKRAIITARKNPNIGLTIGDKIDFFSDGKLKTKSGNQVNLIRVCINDVEVNPNKVEEEEFFSSLETA